MHCLSSVALALGLTVAFVFCVIDCTAAIIFCDSLHCGPYVLDITEHKVRSAQSTQKID